MEKKKQRTVEMDMETALVVFNFFNTAYKDYIAARQLLITNHLIQGCILANTAIEKYFKGMKALLGEPIPRHHDITVNKFINTLENKFNSLYKTMNLDFLKLLSMSYEMRYFDELNANFSILISNKKTLAELDYTVSEIEKSFQFSSQRLGITKRRYQTDEEDKSPALYNMNYILTEISKKEYIESQNRIYEFRKMVNSEILEITYSTTEVKDDNKFIYDAIKPDETEPNTKFATCFKAIN